VILLYNLLWLVALPGVMGYFLVKRSISGKYRQNFKPRLALGTRSVREPGAPQTIWIHALSVGEVLAAIPLVYQVRQQYPQYRIAISTTTEAGQLVARQKLASLHCSFFYFPLDLWWVMRRMVRAVNAALFILVETDLWPNLFHCLAKEGVPAVLANGRLSDRSFARYAKLHKFIAPQLNKIEVLCMQSSEDAFRMRQLGVDPGRIRVTGNLKFAQPAEQWPDREEVIATLGWQPRRLTWIAGSTHAGEEEMIFRVYARLRAEHPECALVLAPRNPERFQTVARMAQENSWETLRRSCLQRQDSQPARSDILILDSIGELAQVYHLGTFAFVGGSLVPRGGHNPLEAARAGLPVLFGPHMENFRDIAHFLLESGAGIQVNDETELYRQARTLLLSPGLCRIMGEKAREAVHRHGGALQRHMEAIAAVLKAAAGDAQP